VLCREDIEGMRITRDFLEKWVGEIFFNETVIGAFVRVSLGKPDQKCSYKPGKVVRHMNVIIR
jgi:hypothetical protein